MKKIKCGKRNVSASQLIRFFAAALVAVSVVFAQPASNTQRRSERMVDFFEVHAADLKSVLRQLSAYSGVDIVAGEDLKANVSIAVSNKSWREILNIICMVHNLAVVEEESFVYVLSQEEYQKRGAGSGAPAAGAGFAAPGGFPGLSGAPLIREVIQLRFTTTDEMAEVLSVLLSEQGKLTPVKHMNALVVIDTKNNIDQIKELVEQIDVQTPQVSISCKIIEVSSGVIQRMGVQWGHTDAANNFTASQLANSSDGIIADGMHRVTYGMLSAEKFNIAMEYLFEDNKAEIVAQPQITTLNNKEARIFMGEQIPINKRDEAGNTVTEMVSAGTQLLVTPYISGDGKIMLALNPRKESYTRTTADGTPIISEQSAQTTVLVNNGETVVIAGLTENAQREAESGIPILKNIPIIGNLFKRSNKSAEKKDLIIFVTPHVIPTGI